MKSGCSERATVIYTRHHLERELTQNLTKTVSYQNQTRLNVCELKRFETFSTIKKLQVNKLFDTSDRLILTLALLKNFVHNFVCNFYSSALSWSNQPENIFLSAIFRPLVCSSDQTNCCWGACGQQQQQQKQQDFNSELVANTSVLYQKNEKIF